MRLLLDTHALIWLYGEPHRLPKKTREALSTGASAIFVSAISIMEITTKHRIGKLPQVTALLDDLDGLLERGGISHLPLTTAQAHRAGLMPIPHKDPFDRMLIAQALVENLTFVSNETQFDNYGIIRLWD